jgi:hypothetical protein
VGEVNIYVYQSNNSLNNSFEKKEKGKSKQKTGKNSSLAALMEIHMSYSILLRGFDFLNRWKF